MSDETDEALDVVGLNPLGWAVVLACLNHVMRECPLAIGDILQIRNDICEQLEIEP